MGNCKLNHEGMCCNCGSPQFKKECNVPCDCRMPMTNYERIKAMSVEEIAKVMLKLSQCEEKDCVNCPLWSCKYCGNIKEIQKWLMSESNKEDD